MSRSSSVHAAALLALGLPLAAAALNPGDLDTSFNSPNGFKTVDIQVNSNARDNSATGIAIQADGRIVLTGAATSSTADDGERMVAVRLTTAGANDGSFGTNGKVLVDGLTGTSTEEYYDGRAAFDATGNIYVFDGTQYQGPTTGWVVARLNQLNGTLDGGWDGDGLQIGSVAGGFAGDIAATPAGDLLILDDFIDTAPTPDNQQMRVCKRFSNGTTDSSFGVSGCRTIAADLGTLKNDFGRVILLRPDGKIVVGGRAESAAGQADFEIALLTSEGDLDPTFGGGDGIVTISFDLAIGNFDEPRALAADALGRIYAGGLAGTGSNGNDSAIVRLLSDGTPDPTYGGGDGKLNFGFASTATASFDQVFGFGLQGDGRLVVVGRGTTAANASAKRAGVARLTEAGDFDTTFGGGTGKEVFDFGTGGVTVGRSMALAGDGSIVLSGFAKNTDNDFFAARLHNDYVFADGFEWGDDSFWSPPLP